MSPHCLCAPPLVDVCALLVTPLVTHRAHRVRQAGGAGKLGFRLERRQSAHVGPWSNPHAVDCAISRRPTPRGVVWQQYALRKWRDVPSLRVLPVDEVDIADEGGGGGVPMSLVE